MSTGLMKHGLSGSLVCVRKQEARVSLNMGPSRHLQKRCGERPFPGKMAWPGWWTDVLKAAALAPPQGCASSLNAKVATAGKPVVTTVSFKFWILKDIC